jgi:EAL domain-containing protein (putative c-di-GMP-specific phosphodiesterase class I)
VLDLTASVGVAPVEPGTSGDELQGRAELAVRAARAAGPGRSARYSPVLGEAAARRDRLRADLEGAVARGELSLVLQPVVSLRDQRVTGLEALLRWRHPELGEVLPAEFVPIAERAGLIGGLQRWVLAEATGAIAALPAGDHPVRVCVNLSTAYLTGGTVVADVEAALRSSGLTPERLVLEVTEDAVCSEQRSVALDVETLRLMGVHVALDDFGTGRSALASLSRLPLDVLKLDGALTTRIDRDRHALALCRSIVTIAHALGLTVVAEEVETPAQLSSLCGIGCDSAQGFLLARPMDRAGLGGLLRESGGQLWPGLVGSR